MVLLRPQAICFFVKKGPCLKTLQMVYIVAYRHIPGYCCQWSEFLVTITVKWSNFFLRRMGKALCERQFALHRQQPEKYKQNVDVSPHGKIWTPMEKGLGPFYRKFADYCCTQYRWTELRQVEANQNVSQVNYDWWKANKSGNDVTWKWNC